MDVWVRGLYGVTSQSNKVTAPGYKGKLAGGTIGLDLEINDRFILGAAYSNLSSKFNYSNNRTGDKTSIGSHAFSIYSQSTINDSIIWKNVASVIISDVTTKYGRGNAIAAGKFRNNTLSLKTEFGYKLSKDNLIIIPNIGLRYTASKDGSYTENGAGIYNIHKSAHSSQSIDATIGASLMTTYAAGNNIDITPKLNASIERNLTNKSQKVRAKFTWMDNHFDNTLKNGKSAKISYNVGGGLTVKKGNIEVSTDYNCNLKKGYASHQGSIKLKVMF